MTTSLIERLAQLQPTISKICKIAGVPGVSVGFSQRGHTIWQWNFGTQDVDMSLAPDSSTVYGIGSLTKCFTATAIAQLVDQGKLSYNTQVKDILPGFKSRNPAVTDLATVEDLLTHRLGLAKSNHWWYGAEGELLLEKADLLPAVSDLQPVKEFRETFDYSNWYYALAGEIIERVTGDSYGAYVKRSITSPLGLRSTTAIHDEIPEANIAKPYATLDDGTFARLPRPKSQNGLIMCPAQGILSSVDDLLLYSSALMSAFQGNTDPVERPRLKGVKTQLFGRIFTAQTPRESSYALGFHRHQLPGAITATGANGMFVKQQPQLMPGVNGPRLVVSHPGSLAGYTSFLAMLPEVDTSVVVLTNSIGLADPAAWIGHTILETLVDTEAPVDILKFVDEASKGHVDSYIELQRKFSELRANNMSPVPDSLEDFTGVYYYQGAFKFTIEVRLEPRPEKGVAPRLQALFQGRESQLWDLQHLEGETFHWLSDRNGQAKRARFTYPFVPGLFKLVFKRGSDGKVNEVIWAHDGAVGVEHQVYRRDVESSPSSNL